MADDLCDLCGSKDDVRYVPGGIFLCKECDDKTNPMREESKAQDKDMERAFQIVERLKGIKPSDVVIGEVESDSIIDDIEFLLDTGLVSLFQPPNVEEEVAIAWKPFIDGVEEAIEEENLPINEDDEIVGDEDEEFDTWSFPEETNPEGSFGTRKAPSCKNCGHSLISHDDICEECGCEDWEESLTKSEEPDPSNPDRELNPDPSIPEPVEPDDGNQIHKKPQTYTAAGIDLPDKVEIPERLYNDLMMMIEYSVTNDNEAGGFLIKAKHGELGVVGEQFGKDREIVLEPNEDLHEGEELIGTVHMHPVTPTASTGDVTSYLNDENEKVMVVVGADKSINFFFKVPEMTHEGDYGDEISDNFEQEDMGMLAEGLGFIWYRGEESDRTTLNLITNIIDDIEFGVLEETWPVEDVVKALGIKGRSDIPDSYSTKKNPLKLVVPFHWNCKERRLV